MLGRLVLQSSHYTIGSLLVTLASIVSFPIFTRTFSVADYGALNLIASLLLFWTGIGKLGVQTALSRFHAEVHAGKGALDESQFVSTVLIGMALTGAAATAGFALMALVVPPAWWHHEGMAQLLLPISALVIVRVVDSAVNNLLRAQQRSILFNVYAVARRYIGLAVILVILFNFMPGLDGYYLGTLVSEGAVLLVVVFYLMALHKVTWRGFSAPTFRAMVAFGVPMIALELSGIVLILGDRYVIQAMIGGEALGQYSAAYNLCQYVQTIIFGSVSQAVVPIYSRLWEEQGEAATRRFVERALRFYFMIGLAVVAGMSAVGTSVLTTLASDKYGPGAIVIPFVIGAMCMDYGVSLFGAGMYIFKKNRLIIPFVIAAAVLNVILNILLIPHLGIVAAGVATLVSYVLISAAAWKISAREFRVNLPLADMAKFALLAVVMYFAVMQVSVANHYLEIGLKIAVGVVVYSALLLAFDHDARQALAWFRARLGANFGGSRP